MLGTWLNWPRRRSSRSNSVETDQLPLESVQEELHTLDLLFPSGESFSSGKYPGTSIQESLRQSAGSFDQLSYEKTSVAASDIRVIIAQDDISFLQKLVLYDSQDDQSSTTHPPWNPIKQPSSTPRSKGSSTLPTRKPPPGLAKSQSAGSESTFSNASAIIPPRLEDPPSSFFRRSQARKTSFSSTSDLDPQDLRKESKEQPTELQTILDCMFGSLGLRYSAQSTKVHVLPRDEQSSPHALARSSREPPISPAKAHFSEYRSDTRAGPFRGTLGPQGASSSVSILVTRMFTAAPSGFGTRGSRTARGKKPSLYAVALIITVPQRTLRSHSAGISRRARDVESVAGSATSDTGPSLGSSAGSGWSVLGSSGFHASSSSSTSTNVYSSTDIVMKKWDIILRILDHLQRSVVSTVSLHHHNTTSAVDFAPFAPGESIGQSSRPSHTRHLSLLPNERPSGIEVSGAASSAISRLMQAFATRLVMTGQQSWGAWREEARGLLRSARNDAQKAFQATLLTAFLANHLDWIHLLQKSQSRRLRSLSRSMEFTDLAQRPQRTILVCNQKMAARRYIYLLCFFFKGGSPPRASSRSTRSGSEGGSFTATHPKQKEIQPGRGEIRNPFPKAPLSGSPLKNSIGVPTKSTLTTAIENSKQKAAPGGLRSGQGLAENTSPLLKRFGMTESTVDLSSSVPTAHFATSNSHSHSPEEDMSPLHVRRGSAASAKLLGNLQLPTATGEQRRDTIHLRSPFGEQAEEPQPFQADYEDTAETPHVRPSNGEPSNREDDAVGEIPIQSLSALNIKRDSCGSGSDAHTPSTVKPMPISNPSVAMFDDTTNTPNAQSVETDEQPLKFSLNEDDGFIDVDIPSSSLNFPMDSPATSILHDDSPDIGSATLAESFFRPSRDSTRQAPLGGYLPLLSQDLTVQAVKPYTHVSRDIHKAMRAEHSPNLVDTFDDSTIEGGSYEQWVDICSTIVADAPAYSVKRLRLRRLIRLTERFDEEDDASEYWTQTDVSEEIVEDDITTPDPHIAEALDTLLDATLNTTDIPAKHSNGIKASDGLSSPSPSVSFSSSHAPPSSFPDVSGSFPGSLDSRHSSSLVHGSSKDMAVKGTIVGALERLMKGAVASVKAEGRPRSQDAEGYAGGESERKSASVLHEAMSEAVRECMTR
ncbi:MAG: hypothetical protein M1831_007091 [Alyxoria varia]|nr:MAG: hypothetical protein M1831_007091 [Alyxoria varia]